jgi:type II secretory ATPase GspE/PulE/Tfp pilus assembly ATPase PilB-like protein
MATRQSSAQLQEEMHQYLETHDHGAVLVTGMAGVGKTQFVVRALWDLFEKSRCVNTCNLIRIAATHLL